MHRILLYVFVVTGFLAASANSDSAPNLPFVRLCSHESSLQCQERTETTTQSHAARDNANVVRVVIPKIELPPAPHEPDVPLKPFDPFDPESPYSNPNSEGDDDVNPYAGLQPTTKPTPISQEAKPSVTVASTKSEKDDDIDQPSSISTASQISPLAAQTGSSLAVIQVTATATSSGSGFIAQNGSSRSYECATASIFLAILSALLYAS